MDKSAATAVAYSGPTSRAPGNGRWRLFHLVLGGLIGAGLLPVITLPAVRGAPEPDPGVVLLRLLMLPLAFAAGVFVHEIGHIVGAKLVGFRFLMLLVPPLAIVRRGTTLHVGVTRRSGFSGGFVSCIPPDTQAVSRRFGVMIIAGPLSNLVVAAVCLGYWGHLATAGFRGPLWFGLLLAGVANLVLALIAGWPREAAGFLTDAAILLLMRRGGPAAERYGAILTLTTLYLGTDVRPREWDRQIVERVTALPDDSPHHRSGCLLAYVAALDSDEIDEAGRWLDELMFRVDTFAAPARPSLYRTAAYYTARFRQDAATARRFLEVGRGGIAEPHDLALAEAAVLLAEGDSEGARRKAAEAESLIGQAINPGQAQYDLERIREIHDLALNGPGSDVAQTDADSTDWVDAPS